MHNKEWTQLRTLRIAGVLSIGAALLAVVGDELSQYSPLGYASLMDIERTLPFWRLLTGEMLGVLGIPLCLIGYWCVCATLRQSSIKGTRGMFWLIAYSLVMGVVSHAIISSMYMVIHAGNTAALASAEHDLQNAAYFPGILFLLGYLGFSVWYFVAVISGRTRYPHWMAFVNPFLLSLLIALLNTLNVLPQVVNILFPAWLSIPHLLFFTFSALFLWNDRASVITQA